MFKIRIVTQPLWTWSEIIGFVWILLSATTKLGHPHTEVVIPKRALKHVNSYQKRKARQRFRTRAGIEAIISHLKFDCRLVRNYLKGSVGDRINLMMAAAAFNFKKMTIQLHMLLRFLICCLVKEHSGLIAPI